MRKILMITASAAAMFTAVGDYLNHAAHEPALLDGVRLSSISLATVIGGLTFSGSLIAFGKLNGSISSNPLNLPAKDAINSALFVARCHRE